MIESGVLLTTDRLTMRPWQPGDAAAGLAIYGSEEVTRWLAPVMEPVRDEDEMRALIERWTNTGEDDEASLPTGVFAVTLREDGTVIGAVSVRSMPPTLYDLELAWQLAPEYWGRGYAIESAQAVARWAFDNAAHELYAVARPGNERARRLAERLGMQWVGETEKYYGLRLQVYRLRPPDLTAPG